MESGWIPIGTQHIGNGFGLAIGPKAGDAKKLDGDQFNVEFENGDPSTPIATHRLFSKQDKPPKVESGEMMLKRQDGGHLFFDKDGAITVTHKGGGFVKIDKDGNHIHDTKDKNISVNAGKGSASFKAKSHSFDGDVKVKGNVKASQSIGAPVVNGTTGGGFTGFS